MSLFPPNFDSRVNKTQESINNTRKIQSNISTITLPKLKYKEVFFNKEKFYPRNESSVIPQNILNKLTTSSRNIYSDYNIPTQSQEKLIANSNEINNKILDETFDDKVMSTLYSPISILILNVLRNLKPISENELISQTKIYNKEKIEYELKKLINKKIIDYSNNKYVLTDTGNKIYKEIEDTLKVFKSLNNNR